MNARGAARVRNGHPWIYRSDVVAAEGIAPGAVVCISGPAGKFLGSALYSTASQIAVRLLTSRRLDGADSLAALLRERIAAAIEYRRRVVADTDAYRVIFSEADLLPGLIVDRYNDVLSIQVLTQAMDDTAVRDLIVHEVAGKFAPEGIVERVEERIRELEQLPPRAPALLYGEKTSTVFTMNGVKFQYDALAGQKTGAFLDQRKNYRAAAHYARGEALDVFCYQGGFALHLARTCERVSAVDSSRAALEIADQNAALNHCEIEWIEANAFDLLKDYAAAGRQYDTIVLDPPAFAKTRRAVPTAIRGYKELNLRALKMLRPGGLLVTCSCSYHVSEAEFMEMLAAASLDARRPLKILERRTQAEDHPILLTVPETQYLKCVLAVVASGE
ncbi:MAG: class I SAM-dependent rRNA methyltransferase [Terriglobales bacterium]